MSMNNIPSDLVLRWFTGALSLKSRRAASDCIVSRSRIHADSTGSLSSKGAPENGPYMIVALRGSATPGIRSESEHVIERESTRLCAGVDLEGQTSIDPEVVVPWVGDQIMNHGMFWAAVGATNRAEAKLP